MAEDQDEGDITDGMNLLKIFKRKGGNEVSIPGPVDSDEYYKFPKRGKCYIFNHKTFAPHLKLDERDGTDNDAKDLYVCFRKLEFDVQIFPDLKVREVNDKLTEAGEEDHSVYSCFVCFILSHGNDDLFFAYDGIFPIQKVLDPFLGDACSSLLGKPKMFFIQACRGNKADDGVKAVYKKESLDANMKFKIPTFADFLIMYSTIPGYLSFRKTRGSWFIESLCEALREHAHDKDLLSILTIVNRKVALKYESCNPLKKSLHKKKQVPLITSTLTRDVKFF